MKRNAFVLAVALAATATTAAAAPASAPAACKTAGLVVWVNTNGNAAAGSTYVTLEFTNQSGRTCTLAGYPGVSALDLRGRSLDFSNMRSTASSNRLSWVRSVLSPENETMWLLSAGSSSTTVNSERPRRVWK